MKRRRVGCATSSLSGAGVVFHLLPAVVVDISNGLKLTFQWLGLWVWWEVWTSWKARRIRIDIDAQDGEREGGDE